MKKLILICAVVALLGSCKKTEDQNPQPAPQINFEQWASTGNGVFIDGGFNYQDSVLTPSNSDLK